jgi:hypothetical protein
MIVVRLVVEKTGSSPRLELVSDLIPRHLASTLPSGFGKISLRFQDYLLTRMFRGSDLTIS